jgi:Flp pilus assembly protein TadG
MIAKTIRDSGLGSTSLRPRKRRGAVAVELALTFSLVIVPMLLGIWEIGCLLDAQSSLVEAVREGGRQAATGQMTNAQIQQVVLQYMTEAYPNSPNITNGMVVTVVNTGSGADASQALQLDPLTVTATLPFRNVDWSFTQKYVSDSSTLTTSCQWLSAKDTAYPPPPPPGN